MSFGYNSYHFQAGMLTPTDAAALTRLSEIVANLRFFGIPPIICQEGNGGINVRVDLPAASSLEVANSTGTPDYAGVNKLITNDADFILSQAAAAQALLTARFTGADRTAQLDATYTVTGGQTSSIAFSGGQTFADDYNTTGIIETDTTKFTARDSGIYIFGCTLAVQVTGGTIAAADWAAIFHTQAFNGNYGQSHPLAAVGMNATFHLEHLSTKSLDSGNQIQFFIVTNSTTITQFKVLGTNLIGPSRAWMHRFH
jgi:hypothetical protein